MPNSGTVTAGSVALASQYNNLRADVLDVATGHTHAGTTGEGAQIEGTALKSTGATAGHVLTAGAGGTATTWAAVQSEAGAFSTATASYDFSASNDFKTTYVTTQSGTISKTVGVGGAGTVLLVIGVPSPSVSSRQIQTFAVGAHTANATASSLAFGTISGYVGGTVNRAYPAFNNQASSTSVYWMESVWNAGQYNTAFRKYNQTLAASQWNAVLQSADSEAFSYILFNNGFRVRFAPLINCWFGHFDFYHTSNKTARTFIINDTSGSVYAADYGENGAGGTSLFAINASVFVPNDGTAIGGSVYTIGSAVTSTTVINRRLVKYTAGTASFVAAGTTDSTVSPRHYPVIGGTAAVQSMFYDNTLNKVIVVRGGGTVQVVDRSFATVEYESVGTSTMWRERIGNYLFSDNGVALAGALGTGYAPSGYLLPITNSVSGFIEIAPGGTPSAYAPYTANSSNPNEFGTAFTYGMNNFRQSDATFGTVDYGRMLWQKDTGVTIITTGTTDMITMDGTLSYLPANGVLGGVATNATATGTVTRNFYQLRMK
jgi:hypothetical protein